MATNFCFPSLLTYNTYNTLFLQLIELFYWKLCQILSDLSLCSDLPFSLCFFLHFKARMISFKALTVPYKGGIFSTYKFGLLPFKIAWS